MVMIQTDRGLTKIEIAFYGGSFTAIPVSMQERYLAVAKEYIDSNYDRGITVASAASYVYLSQGYFTRAFRDEFGISPMSYLMKKRIERACELLSDKQIKVAGVASMAGFSSPQRFNVAFRKQMGITPMEYRKQHAGGYEE